MGLCNDKALIVLLDMLGQYVHFLLSCWYVSRLRYLPDEARTLSNDFRGEAKEAWNKKHASEMVGYQWKLPPARLYCEEMDLLYKEHLATLKAIFAAFQKLDKRDFRTSVGLTRPQWIELAHYTGMMDKDFSLREALPITCSMGKWIGIFCDCLAWSFCLRISSLCALFLCIFYLSVCDLKMWSSENDDHCGEIVLAGELVLCLVPHVGGERDQALAESTGDEFRRLPGMSWACCGLQMHTPHVWVCIY